MEQPNRIINVAGHRTWFFFCFQPRAHICVRAIYFRVDLTLNRAICRPFCYFDFTKWIIGDYWPTKSGFYTYLCSVNQKNAKNAHTFLIFWYNRGRKRRQSHSQTIPKWTFFLYNYSVGLNIFRFFGIIGVRANSRVPIERYCLEDASL